MAGGAHRAHASAREAAEYAWRIHLDVYRAVLEGVLAIPVLTGLKTPAERFAGATATLTCEGMMRDGKALQLESVAAAGAALASLQDALLEQARTELDRRAVEVTTLDQALEASADGFARFPWGRCGPEEERRANAAGVTVRCLMRPDGSIPDNVEEDGLVAVLGRAY
ncbi:MAG TPA: hypothetical protein VFN65_00660 [Solirubrobacteraceae bacterium]|nr:hypothetical protein [Solirubrobacteraceae bacterium]